MEILRLIAAKLVLGEQPTEELPRLATDALIRGLDSPDLCAVAGANPRDVRDARDAFVSALQELGIELPDEQQALWTVARDMMQQILDGTVEPVVGAEWIWWHVHNRIEREGDLRVFVGLASEWEDYPPGRDAIEAAIREAAVDLLNRDELRMWVKVQARNGESPVRNPRNDRPMVLSDLPISDQTRSDLTTWAQDFDRVASKPGRGPSGFASTEDAAAFVARGAQLVGIMQRELDADWHVEYMQTASAFPTKMGSSFRESQPAHQGLVCQPHSPTAQSLDEDHGS